MYVSVSTPESRRRVRSAGAVTIGVTLTLGGAACTGGSSSDAEARPPAKLSVTPANAAGKVRPDSSIVVKAVDGTIQNVTVTTKGNPVEGQLGADKTEWRSRWRLDPGVKYQVVATALGKDGKTQTTSSDFSTAKVKDSQAITTSIEAPFDKETVGVGIPIILRFDKEVFNRAEVERALEVRASKPVEGAWHWFDSQTVVFRTKQYWPRFTKVSFVAHMSGVRAAKSVYGTKNLKLGFQIGEKKTSKASAKTHRMLVYKNGKKIRNFPVSMGKGGLDKYTTTNGDHLTMEKDNPVIMDSTTVGCGPGCPDYYRQVVNYAVRISNSGEYTHSAPWSVGSQGYDNVSHGCVNMAPSAAAWFYDFSHRGDPYKITGTSRELEPDNGWGYWQLDWKGWLAGSALKQSFAVGPHGSTPVVPSATPTAPTASATPTPTGSGSATPTSSGTPSPSATPTP